MSMSRAMGEIVEDPVDMYWLTVSFYKQQYKFKDFYSEMVCAGIKMFSVQQYNVQGLPAYHLQLTV